MKATYIKTRLPNVINITKIVTVHYYEVGRAFNYEGEKHDFWEMVYIDKGEAYIEADGSGFILRQGELVFHKPNEFHTIRANNSAPNIFVITFVCSSAAMNSFKNYRATVNKELKAFIGSIINEAKRTFFLPVNNPHLKQLVVKEDAEIGGLQLIKTYLEQFLIMLMRLKANKKESGIFPSKELMENHLVSSIKNIIAENIYENLSLAVICDKLGYSKTYLSKIFKQQTGYTIAFYFNLCRIERAKQLIREDGMNFAQISDLLKFDNPQYFSRVFKRVNGMTPSEFKRTAMF